MNVGSHYKDKSGGDVVMSKRKRSVKNRRQHTLLIDRRQDADHKKYINFEIRI